MSRTQILEPLTDVDKESFPNISKIFEHTCTFLNELKSGDQMTFAQFLDKLQITEEVYITAIRSSLKVPKLFLKRNVSEIRVNSYNDLMLKSWQANIDVQFIFDAYACAAYIVSYISKSQRGMSNLMHAPEMEIKVYNSKLVLKRQCTSFYSCQCVLALDLLHL